MKKILIVVGTRPNFIKVTQFKKAGSAFKNIDIKIVHTGQHYDRKMADVFFEQFGLTPDFFLNISNGSPNTQMAEIMLGVEKVIREYAPTLMIVVGDVNSTLAAALAANKMNVKLAHIESGLRSYDRTMPEEFNRVLTDELTDYFFVTEQSGIDNLKKENKNSENIFFVGNTMIDTMVAFEEEIQRNDILKKLNVEPKKFVLMTMHRPATVDQKEGIEKLLELMEFITKKYKLIFPIHPRTIKKIKDFKLDAGYQKNSNLILTEPLDYFAFQKLIFDSKFILTDSGGIQEESTFRKIPCLTLRANTERPSTTDMGTNTLIPFDLRTISDSIAKIEKGEYKKGIVPPLWDGHATTRIVEKIIKITP